MKKISDISASFDSPELLENLVEHLAYRRYDIGYAAEKTPEGLVAIDTASAETYVSGGMSLKQDYFNMPFITCFLFTCIKNTRSSYMLRWSMSLS